MVDVLAGDDGGDGAGVGALDALLLVSELGLLRGQASLDVVGAVVLELSVLDGEEVVVVLLLKHGGIRYRLHGGVVVVLVHLLVDGGLDVLMLLAFDGLVRHGGGDLRWGGSEMCVVGHVMERRGPDLLVDGGVMVTRLGHEVLNGGLGGLHGDEGSVCVCDGCGYRVM
ncbi:hypothetical protein Tdes44962_MAKER07977 [Teratosphaeria destructans]|uniref:Uncharacterized protein n=1 Tax=Teratosphaeria destructans TaxID=418781 RepID=A0A9W7W5I8_9PEZI|nr:hypothetical protein Tdes44962_MAKER07977 [Teratosphaeria destructans]